MEEPNEHPLERFCEALERRFDRLLPKINTHILHYFPALAAVPEDVMLQANADGLRSYLVSTMEPDLEPLRQRVVASSEALVVIGGAPENARHLLEASRQEVLAVALELVAEGFPHAREGTLQLMASYSAGLEATTKMAFTLPQAGLVLSAPLLRVFAEVCPEAIAVSSMGEYMSFANESMNSLMGRELTLGETFGSLVVPAHAGRWAAAREAIMAEQHWRGRLRLLGAEGHEVPVDVTAFRLQTEGGGEALCCIVRDVSELLKVEQERLRLQAEVIATQDAAIRELMTPLLPLAEGVVAMPIVGTVDATRGASILDALLEGIAARQARVAILDITGMSVVDTHVAEGLLRAARAAKLLGTELIVTGIRGAVAQTLVGLDVHLDGMITCATLQEGVARAMRLARKTR
ncbi:STAS domain-containing protein [Chondromyces crocatus]|uniref:STAS domain-containing protein n=1 Tax=Chondromyces crocatus TaxID=52 RepID=A0A0K1EQ72_CHOCO|nr:STAS domain-containing protein [Chondromyces crocatus]AKT42969.1 uncharacterized protein CMC5_071970 [Chondromyces crocatus]